MVKMDYAEAKCSMLMDVAPKDDIDSHLSRTTARLGKALLVSCIWTITICSLTGSGSARGNVAQSGPQTHGKPYDQARNLQVKNSPPKQANCPSDRFYNQTSESCVDCHYSCSACTGPEAWECLVCDSETRIQTPSEVNQTRNYNPRDQVEMLTYRCLCPPGHYDVQGVGCKRISSDTKEMVVIFIIVFLAIFAFSYVALKYFPQHFTNNPFAFVPSDQDNSRAALPVARESQMNYFTNIQQNDEQQMVTEPRLQPADTNTPTSTGRKLFTEPR